MRADKLKLTSSEKGRLITADWRALAIRARFQANALANLIGFSLRRLERHFQARANCTPREWLHEMQMRISAQRLAEGASVHALMTELSFFDRSHFHHWFRDFYWVSLGEFVAARKRSETARTSRGRLVPISLPTPADMVKALEALETPFKEPSRTHAADRVKPWPARHNRVPQVLRQAMKRVLTPREVEVCLMLMDGTEKEAAIRLGISVPTVHAHCERAFKKFSIHSRRALAAALAGYNQ